MFLQSLWKWWNKKCIICTALPQFVLALWFFSSITISWRLSWIINRITFKILKEKIICSKVNVDIIVYLSSSAEEFHVVVIWSKPLIHPPHGRSLGWIYHVPVWLTHRQQASENRDQSKIRHYSWSGIWRREVTFSFLYIVCMTSIFLWGQRI